MKGEMEELMGQTEGGAGREGQMTEKGREEEREKEKEESLWNLWSTIKEMLTL